MAEAHQAVAFQFAVTDEGISIHFDRSAVRSAFDTLAHLSIRRIYRLRTAFLKGIFPATPLSLLVVTSSVFGLYAAGIDPSLGLHNLSLRITKYVTVPLSIWTPLFLLVQSTVIWTFLCYVQRYTLKGLLLYKGWMFDERGKRSLKTKIWAILVKLVAGSSSPLLGSYQQSLPRLPLPSITDTCSRYLKSVRPMLSDDEYQEKERLVKDFLNNEGNRLQRYLFLKSWMSSNYVTDWWEKYVYLSWRGSLMINSNYYACDAVGRLCSNNREARAAQYTYSAMLMKKEIENDTLPPLIVMDLIPLCSYQYKRVFGTCRLPGKEQDVLFHATPTESRHIVVNYNGNWYKVPLYSRNRLLLPHEIEHQFKLITSNATPGSTGEQHLAALTSADRPFWAEVREKYFSSGSNRANMEAIEKAALILVFDDWTPNVSLYPKPGEERNVSEYCKDLIHGQGYKMWLDKSFTSIFYKNARLGINAEHSWADAPIIGYLMEYCSSIEAKIGYQEDGHCMGELSTTPPAPQKMNWNIPQELDSKIEEALSSAQEAISDLDLYVLLHDAFGKGLIKKCGISPDAFIQMALQLTYYKISHEFCLTYEASMTRLFLEGRTETVRPCSVQSADFVYAMCNPESNDEERRKLLKEATDAHVLSYKNAMVGKGLDRHLFCLYVVSRGKNIPSEFLSKVIAEPWKLSTSQTPTQQTGRVDYKATPDVISPGGGFGPVTKDGYGVSYIIPGDDRFYFHVSSFKSSPHTDSERFASTIKESLADMIKLHGLDLK